MVALFFCGFILLLGVFSLVNFKFISVLLLLENLNILLLFFSYVITHGGIRVSFLIFMVVATIEVTLALVSLTRLWDSDSLLY